MSALVRIGFRLYRRTISRFMLSLLLDLENRRVDSFIGRDHRVHRKTFPDTSAAGGWIDLRKPLQRPHGFVDIVHQKTRPPLFNHFAAGAQIYRDHGYARGIGFRQDKSESFRDGVQMEQSTGTPEQLIFARYVHRPDVADVLIEVRFHLLPEICLILDNARDEQRQSAPESDFDRQMDTFVRMNPAAKDQI